MSPNPRIEKYEDEAVFSFEVSDIYYLKLKTQLYRYRIKRLNEEWTELNNERRFILARLPVGQYQLEIQSRLPSEKWLNNSLTIDLIVQGNFWKSINAIYLIAMLILMIFIATIYFVSRHFKVLMLKMKTRLSLE